MSDDPQQTTKLPTPPPRRAPAAPSRRAQLRPTPVAPPAAEPAAARRSVPRFPIPGGARPTAAEAEVPEEAAKEAELKEEESAELIAQRDRLLEKFTVMQADLGGAFYEMAIRDHVRLDVLTRKAAELQRVDAELLAVERVLELQRDDAAGLCPSCGAPSAPRCASAPSAARR